MAKMMDATVVLAKCSKKKQCFGIRVEKRGGQWIRTWAFPIDERAAKNEGFAANKVSVGGADDEFPGCPHCKDGGFTLCTCGKIGCSGGLIKEGKNATYTCPWCGQTGEVEMKETIDVSSGGY